MKSLISALVISAASVFPASAGIHDFKPSNVAPAPAAAPGTGRCLSTRDNSNVCFLRLGNKNYSIAIHDVDKPGQATSVYIDCKTGRWNSYGILPTSTVTLYMDGFCNMAN